MRSDCITSKYKSTTFFVLFLFGLCALCNVQIVSNLTEICSSSLARNKTVITSTSTYRAQVELGLCALRYRPVVVLFAMPTRKAYVKVGKN